MQNVFRNKSECDGFLKTYIIRGLNQNEMRSFFNIGYFRYRRLLEYDPTKPVPHVQPNNPNFVTKEKREFRKERKDIRNRQEKDPKKKRKEEGKEAEKE